MPSGDPSGAPSDDFPAKEADNERVEPELEAEIQSEEEESAEPVEHEELDNVEESAETEAEAPEGDIEEDGEDEEEEDAADESEDETEDEEASEEEQEEDEEEYEEEDEPAAATVAAEESDPKAWYVLKVQSNREDSIREAILRRVKIAGLEDDLGEIVVPTEKISEIKGGKKRVTERKFFPGYIMVHVDLNHDIWFAIRETPGVGDFVGANNQPVPMTREDVDRMLGREADTEVAQPRLKINFEKGDRVKIKEGTFENFEGDVEEVIEAKGLVRVMIQIFGRPTPVELEYWQVEPVD